VNHCAPPALAKELETDSLNVAIRNAREPIPEELFDRALDLLRQKGLPSDPEDVLTVVGYSAGYLSRGPQVANLLTRVEDLHSSLSCALSLLKSEVERSGRLCSEAEMATLKSLRATLARGLR